MLPLLLPLADRCVGLLPSQRSCKFGHDFALGDIAFEEVFLPNRCMPIGR